MNFFKEFGIEFDLSKVSIGNYQDEPRVSDEPKENKTPENVYHGRVPVLKEIVEVEVKMQQTVNLKDDKLRKQILSNFETVVLRVIDTKTAIQLKPIIKNDDLAFNITSINKYCSKLHIEDVSPVTDSTICNHDDVKCGDVHFDDSSLLLEPNDFSSCLEEDAIFQSMKGRLYFLKGDQWKAIKLSNVSIDDGFYTLIQENFIDM